MNNFNSFIRKLSIILLLLFIFTSCAEKNKQAPPSPEIQVVEVLIKDVPIYKEFVGQIYGQFDIPIRARVSGFLDGIHFREGERVKKGALLYTIDPQPFEADVAKQMSKVAEAKTALVKAESDLNRIKPLAEMNAVSQSDLDAAQANYEAALAYVDAAEANLRLSKITLGYATMYAPIKGIIGKTKARVGEFVGQDPNPVILNTVSTIENIRVEFFLSEADYLRMAREYRETLKKLREKTLKPEENRAKLDLILADGSVFKYQGIVDFIDREIDPSTGAILLQATFPNPDQILRPGLFGKIRAVMQNIKNGVLVPQRCITELQGKHSVYVVDTENTVQFREVEVGETIGDMWLIDSGLKEGDIVVLEGLQHVRSGMVINPVLETFQSKSALINN